jgi:flagellar motor switch protein FliG
LDDAEVHRIGREMTKLSAVTGEVVEGVLAEFRQMIVCQNYVLKGGIEYARKIMTAAFGPEHAGNLIDRLAQTVDVDYSKFDALQRADPQQLANLVQNEHPQTIALILSHLGPTQAARLLNGLPAEARADVTLRMASLDHISPEIIAKIADIVGEKILDLGEADRQTFGGVRAVAEMLNNLSQSESEVLLNAISVSDPVLSRTIRDFMLTFEDLIRIDQIGIRNLLERVDRNMLVLALKGTSDELKTVFLEGMSKRAAETMREDIEALGSVKVRDVASAQQQVLSAVRSLEAEGIIVLNTSEEEQYVS